MKKGYLYILKCSDNSYYTGSTNNLEYRLKQHQNGEGANHTKKRLPVSLVYFEEFSRIDEAFYREKQIQGWSRKKKEALIGGFYGKLPQLSKAYRDVGGFESLNHHNPMPEKQHNPMPEALEGRAANNPMPEALEGRAANKHKPNE